MNTRSTASIYTEGRTTNVTIREVEPREPGGETRYQIWSSDTPGDANIYANYTHNGTTLPTAMTGSILKYHKDAICFKRSNPSSFFIINPDEPMNSTDGQTTTPCDIRTFTRVGGPDKLCYQHFGKGTMTNTADGTIQVSAIPKHFGLRSITVTADELAKNNYLYFTTEDESMSDVIGITCDLSGEKGSPTNPAIVWFRPGQLDDEAMDKPVVKSFP